jgi:hypothetical protein
MTSQDNHTCSTCGAALAQPQEQQPPAPAPKRFLVEYHAPGGVIREVAVAPDDNAAGINVEDGALNENDFEPDDNAYCIRQIIIMDENNVEQAIWTDPEYLAQLHAGEIYELLENMIETADQLSEQKHSYENAVYEMVSAGEQAALSLKTIHREGGAE